MFRYLVLHLQKFLKKRRTLLILTILGIFLLVSFSISLHRENSLLNQKIQNYIVLISSPFEVGLTEAFNFCSNQINQVKELFSAKKELDQQKEKIVKLKEAFLESKILKQENADLKKKLAYIENKGIKFKTAKLIANFYNSSLKEAFIDAGTKDGIKENNLIFNEDGAIGRVLNVEENNSKIILLNDIRSYIPAKSITNGNKMIISGTGGNLLEVKFISENKVVEIDEVLLTSSEANLVPDNIPIGKVVGSDGEKYLVKSFADLNNFDIVFIYLNE